MINITFPDGAVKPFVEGITAYEIAESISPRLAADVLAAQVNGVVYDLNRPIDQDATISLLKWDSDDAKRVFWHSSSHLMAEALEALYPGVKFGIGPAVENGFYYDVDLCGQQIINELQDGTITYYENGDFTDLCRGPHLRNTEVIKAVKLTAIAGAYWRGDEKRQQLTRIYGITFPKKSMLEEYLVMMEEAKKRDHRKLGKEMELFTFSQRVGLGLPLWLPRGAVMRNILEGFLRKKQTELGYLPVVTPHIGSKELYITSGHYAKYGKDSFQPIRTPQEGEEYMLKPMNCPHHCEIFASKPRSYRDLPLRLAEFGTVYRYEQSGELHGLTRVRSFTQDDAHLFCRPDQVKQEFLNVMDIIDIVLTAFGFNFEAQISLRDPNDHEKYVGTDEDWALAERAIVEACQEKGLPAKVEYGEAAFYGPKLDFMIKDAIGRRWQLGTIQVDYNLPKRFELEYTDEDNTKKTPVMIHRAPFGSMERFCAVLIEHTSGHFPLWLTPDQVAILPLSEKYNDYAREVAKKFDLQGVRATIDLRNEKLGRKIRDNELKRIPYMVIVGEKEQQDGTVAVRPQGGGEQSVKTIQEFIDEVNARVAEMTKDF